MTPIVIENAGKRTACEGSIGSSNSNIFTRCTPLLPSSVAPRFHSLRLRCSLVIIQYMQPLQQRRQEQSEPRWTSLPPVFYCMTWGVFVESTWYDTLFIMYRYGTIVYAYWSLYGSCWSVWSIPVRVLVPVCTGTWGTSRQNCNLEVGMASSSTATRTTNCVQIILIIFMDKQQARSRVPGRLLPKATHFFCARSKTSLTNTCVAAHGTS
jgi:hypothetical protein